MIQRIRDFILELRIEVAFERVLLVRTDKSVRAACDHLASLIRRRSPDQLQRMRGRERP